MSVIVPAGMCSRSSFDVVVLFFLSLMSFHIAALLKVKALFPARNADICQIIGHRWAWETQIFVAPDNIFLS